MKNQKNLTIIDHPLAQDKLWHLRNKATTPDNFRRLISEVSEIFAYEITRNLKTKQTVNLLERLMSVKFQELGHITQKMVFSML